MFSKEEVREFTKLFWTSYGKYMQKHIPTFHRKSKWTNYKTGVKHLFFRLRVTKKNAEIAIEIQHPDDGIRDLFYEQFMEVKRIFENTIGEWNWEKECYNEYQAPISKISLQIEKVNIYNKDTWHTIFQFFEQHQVPFDEFWTDFGEMFADLEK